MEKIISAQIALSPIESKNYINDINKALSIIKSHGLEYEINALSTTIIGEQAKVFELINVLFCELDKQTKFTLDIKMSNICGCANNKK